MLIGYARVSTDILSDLRMVEGRIASLLEERGLQPHSFQAGVSDGNDEEAGDGSVTVS